MITPGGKRNPAKADLGAGTRARRRRINPDCPLAVIRRCNSAGRGVGGASRWGPFGNHTPARRRTSRTSATHAHGICTPANLWRYLLLRPGDHVGFRLVHHAAAPTARSTPLDNGVSARVSVRFAAATNDRPMGNRANSDVWLTNKHSLWPYHNSRISSLLRLRAASRTGYG